MALLALSSACDNDGEEGADTILSGTLTDSPVGGLSYWTDTLSGVTDSQGRFRYRRGESIQFVLGATEIGDLVPAKGVMTPFDLVPGAVIPRAMAETRPAIEVDYPNLSIAGLEVPLPNMVVSDRERAFRRVANILVLLQSLDDDGDLMRIGISPETASLFEDVRLNFDLDMHAFFQSKVVRHKVEEAARHGLVRNWVPRKPGLALDHFYSRRAIHQFFAVPVTMSTNSHGAFPSVQTEVYEYDAMGNVVRRTLFSETDEGPTPSTVRAWSYNGNGDETEFSTDYDADGIFDDRVLTEYDDVGRWFERRIDENGDGIVDDLQSRSFEADGTETISYDYDFDGTVDVTETTVFSDNGFETLITEYGFAGSIHEITVLSYDASGNLVSSGRRYAPGIPFHRQTTRTYDVNGRLSEIRHDSYNDGTSVTVLSFERDSIGRLVGTSKMRPNSMPGGSERYDYTDSGQLSSFTRYRPDSTVDRVLSWRYAEDDSLSTIVTDIGGDGAAELTREIVLDRIGNRVTVSRFYGNRIASEVKVFDYDKFGILTAVTTDGFNSDADGMVDISVEVTSKPANWVSALDENYYRYENFVPRRVYLPTIYPDRILTIGSVGGM